MCNKFLYLLASILVLSMVLASAAIAADPNLAAWWKFDESSGTVAYDSIGTIDATLYNSPTWVTGYRNNAVSLDGVNDYVQFPYQTFSNLIKTLRDCTFSIWAYWNGGAGWQRFIDFGSGSSGNYIYLTPLTGSTDAAMRLALNNSSNGLGIWDEFNASSGSFPIGSWHHIAITFSETNSKTLTLYLDGNVVGSKANCTNTVRGLDGINRNWLGRSQWTADPYLNGILDDFQIYTRVLSKAELEKVANPEKASMPVPEDGGFTGQTSLTLLWTAGVYVASVNGHHVYFGTDYDNVNAGTNGTDKGLTSAANYPVADLVFGTTYYWRIDEVNGANTWRGKVWSFTVTPLKASNPSPTVGATYVDPNVDLVWSSGAKAKTHSVYFGTAHPLPLVSSGKTTISYDPGRMAFGATYYWRIDEVNGADTWSGDEWSFTVSPIEIADPNLRCWWKFDDGAGSRAIDWSGYNLHATLVDSPVWINGQINGALQLDGDNDYVDLPIGQLISTLHSATIATWVNYPNADGFWQNVFNFMTDTTNFIFLVPCSGDNQDQPMYLGIAAQGGTEVGITASTGILESGWHHIAVVLASGVFQLYKDGELVGSTTPTAVLSDLGVTTNNWLGRGRWPNWAYLNGALDDFRIYDKALTQDDMKEVMRGDPLLAWNPTPSNGSIPDVEHATPLSWSPGDKAVQHDVYFGDDLTAVVTADTSTAGIYCNRHSNTIYDPLEDLQWGQSYYWRVDEVNGTDIWKAGVWTFTVADYLVVDDFEDYDANCMRIYYTWWDKYPFSANTACGVAAQAGNGTGATVGTDSSPWVEQTITHESPQSMPMAYDNTKSPFYSEAVRTFATPQDWTRLGVKALTVWFRGDPGNTIEPLYMAINDKIVTYEDPNAVISYTWLEWNIPLKVFSDAGVDLKSINKIVLGVGNKASPKAGGTGTMYFDDIRLYRIRCVPSLQQPAADLNDDCAVDYNDVMILAEQWLDSGLIVTPVAPGNANLVGWWKFDDGSGTVAADSSGKGNNGTLWGDMQWVDGYLDHAVRFDGFDDHVEFFDIGSLIGSLTRSTFALWVDFPNTGGSWQHIFDFGSSVEVVYMFLTPSVGTGGSMRFAITTGGNTEPNEQRVTAPTTLPTGWHHVAVTISDPNSAGTRTITLYLDGSNVAQNTQATLSPSDLGATTNNWLGRSGFVADAYFEGLLDDFRIYNRALSVAEVAWLAGKTSPFSELYDLNGDGAVNLKDFSKLAQDWLEETLWP